MKSNISTKEPKIFYQDITKAKSSAWPTIIDQFEMVILKNMSLPQL